MRVATPADAEAIDALMKESGAALFPTAYDGTQAASMVRFVSQVDSLLLEDGTYFVLEAGGELVGCGGWSRRDKLYTGGDDAGGERLLDPATGSTGRAVAWGGAFWRRARRRRRERASARSSCRRRCPGCPSTSRTGSSESRSRR